jgi:hypothetical protein
MMYHRRLVRATLQAFVPGTVFSFSACPFEVEYNVPK